MVYAKYQPPGPWDEDLESLSPSRRKLFEQHPELRCKAYSRVHGRRCGDTVVRGYEVCRYHGANPTNHGGWPAQKRNQDKSPSGNSLALKYPTSLNPEMEARRRKYDKAMEEHPHLLDLYRTLVEDPELLSLQSEIALIRARLTQRIEGMPSDNENSQAQLDYDKHLAGMAEQVAKLVDRQHKMEFDSQNVLTVQATMALAARLAAIINLRVRDEATRELIGHDLSLLFGGLPVHASTEAKIARSLPIGSA